MAVDRRFVRPISHYFGFSARCTTRRWCYLHRHGPLFQDHLRVVGITYRHARVSIFQRENAFQHRPPSPLTLGYHSQDARRGRITDLITVLGRTTLSRSCHGTLRETPKAPERTQGTKNTGEICPLQLTLFRIQHAVSKREAKKSRPLAAVIRRSTLAISSQWEGVTEGRN